MQNNFLFIGFIVIINIIHPFKALFPVALLFYMEIYRKQFFLDIHIHP